MSDTPQGGWWQANDGKWYPPETHPDHVPSADDDLAAGPPAAGWWQASDGNWYPPETHPDHSAPATIDLTSSSDPVSASPGAAEWDAAWADESDTVQQGVSWHSPAGQGGVEAGRTESGLWDLTPPGSVDTIAHAGSDTAEPMASSALAPEVQEIADPAPSVFDVQPTVATPDPAAESWTPTPTAEPVEAASFAPPPIPDSTVAPSAPPPLFGAPDVPQTRVSEWLEEPTPLPVDEATSPAFTAQPAVDDPDAPLPGWHKGADGAWYPPNQEAPSGGGVFPRSAPSPIPPADPNPAAAPTKAPKAPKAPGSGPRVGFIAAGAAVVLIAAAVVLFTVLGGGGSDDETAEVEPTTTTAPPTTEAIPTTVAPDPSTPTPPQSVGTGSDTVDMGRVVTEQYLALITHEGAGPFALSLLGPDSQVSQQLVSEAEGQFLGVFLVNPELDQAFSRLQVQAAGSWAVTFAPVSTAPQLTTLPGESYDGTGDEVVGMFVDTDLTMQIQCPDCTSPLTVTAWGEGVETVEPTEIDVDGEFSVRPGTTAVQVDVPSGGPPPRWTLRVS